MDVFLKYILVYFNLYTQYILRDLYVLLVNGLFNYALNNFFCVPMGTCSIRYIYCIILLEIFCPIDTLFYRLHFK